MRALLVALMLFAFAIDAAPAQAQARSRNRSAGYYNENGDWVSRPAGYYDSEGRWVRRDRVRSHRRRRNVLLGVGAVGLVTGSGLLKGVGLGGAVANEVIDNRNRDW